MDHELLTHWKSQYGSIYSAQIKGKDYVFRAAAFEEFEALELQGQELSSAEQEDYLVSTCLLSPSEAFDIDKIPAGVVSALATEILDVSGFGAPKKAISLLDVARQKASEFRYIMTAFIVAGMPTYNDEVLKKYNFEQLAHKAALSEQILKIHAESLQGEVALRIVDPEEEAKKAQAQPKKTRGKPGKVNPNDPIAQRLMAGLHGVDVANMTGLDPRYAEPE